MHITKEHRLIALGTAAISIIVLALVSFGHVARAAQECSQISSAADTPMGFGSAVNLFSSTQEKVISAQCNDTSATIAVGSWSSQQYIYDQGYEFVNNAWKPFTYSGANKTGQWIVGRATKVLNRTPGELAQQNYVVAYICTWTNNAWKCGCRDGACTENYWQLQIFRLPVTPQPSPTVSAEKCPGAAARADQCPAGCVYYGVPLGCITKDQADYCRKSGNCAECLARDTMIAAPEGEVAVQDIAPGTRVWTVNKSGQRVSAEVLKVGSTQAPIGHWVVHLVLADGRTLFVSPEHPTADGRTAGQVKAGDLLNGVAVEEATLVPYDSGYTYDILPAGDTGEYFANGILIGSTLK